MPQKKASSYFATTNNATTTVPSSISRETNKIKSVRKAHKFDHLLPWKENYQ